jgi:hypothetical protein
VVVGEHPTTTNVATSVCISAQDDPGVDLLVSFVPHQGAPGGVRRVAATQLVTAIVSVEFDVLLPIYWMASVLRAGDLAPNQMTQPYIQASDEFELEFGGEIIISHDADGWQIPAFEAAQYTIYVGFGIGQSFVCWGYSVPCKPGERVPLSPGSYQLVRSDGDERIGDPVAAGSETWSLPLGFSYGLTFDSSGKGILRRCQSYARVPHA